MPDPNPTVSELFKAITVIDDDVSRLVQGVLNGATDQGPARRRRRGRSAWTGWSPPAFRFINSALYQLNRIARRVELEETTCEMLIWR